eukprot:10206009-Ditylum_brightwellii.AAC.1
MEKRKIIERSAALVERATTDQDKTTREEMETINDEITRIMKEAEDKIPSSHKSWWSDTFHHAFQIHKYWKAAQLLKLNNINGDMILQSRRNNIDPDADIYQGDKERSILAQLRKAKKQLTECRRESHKLRQEYLQRKTEEEASNDPNSKTAAILQQIKNREASNPMHTILQQYVKPEQNRGITFIKVPDKEKFITNIQYAVTTYKRTKDIEKRNNVIFLYWFMSDEKNGLTKFLPHKRVVNKDEMNDEPL